MLLQLLEVKSLDGSARPWHQTHRGEHHLPRWVQHQVAVLQQRQAVAGQLPLAVAPLVPAHYQQAWPRLAADAALRQAAVPAARPQTLLP